MTRVNAWAFAEPRVLDDNGDPVSDGQVYIYQAGTTTEIPVTSDLAGNTSVTQPITADAAGRLADSYILPQSFKVVYVDASDTELQTIDNIEVASGTFVYDTYALLTAATGVPSGQAYFQTLGYYARGDGGGADYVRVASEPSHNFKNTVNAGAVHVEGLPRDGVVNTKALGAACDVTGDFNATSSGAFTSENTVIDGATDDTSAIQNAIDYAIHYGGNQSSSQPVIVRHTGKSRITDTIHLGYGDGTATSVLLEGPWAPLRGEDNMCGASLCCTFSDRPMVNFQGVRGSGLRNIFLRGGLDYTGVVATNTGTTPTTESNWDAVMAVSQYAPYALITVDAYSGTEPGSPYPDVTYPSYLSQTQYGKAISSRVFLDGVIGRNAQVFVCVKPSDDGNNADFVSLKRCYFEYGKHGVSIGNGQSRNVGIEDCVFNRVFDVFVNTVHGQQAGQFGGPIKNCNFGGFINKIFAFGATSTVGSTLSFENLFAENLHMIGSISGATSGDTPLLFMACRFNFRHDDTNGVPPVVADFASMTSSVRFESCAFTGFPDGIGMLDLLNGTFVNCEMADAEPSAATRLFHNATTGGLVLQPDPRYASDVQSVTFSQRALSTGTEGRITADWRMETTGRDYCMPLWLRNACHSGASTLRWPIDKPRPFYRHQAAKGTCWSSASRSDKVISGTWTSMTIEELAWEGGYVGDLWVDVSTGAFGYVSSVTQDGSDVDIECTLLSNYVSDGGGGYDLFDTSLSLTTGNVAFLNCRVWATSAPLRGRSASGSTSLVAQSEASTATTTILGDIVASGNNVNDMLANAQRSPDHFDSATDCEVASVSSPTITMGGNSAETWGSGSGDWPLYISWWIRNED